MTKSAFVDQMEKIKVYYRMGDFKNDVRPKFARAPFEIVRISGEEYVMPTSIGGTAADLDTVISATTTNDEYYMGRTDFGYYSLPGITTYEQEWGDPQKEGMRAVHCFGFI